MKIAFWSNVGEKCGVSSNLAAISVASAIRFPYTVTVLENHLSHNNLGRAYMGRTHVDMLREVGTNYYEGGGIEGLLRKIYRGEHSPGMLSSYIKEIIQDHLYYIPQSKVIHNEIFDYEFDHCINRLFQLMEEHSDISFIDTTNHNSLSTIKILEEADLIVVNLCQNSIILEDFFLSYPSLKSKAVFLIGNYTGHSILNSKRISKMYEIPLENITVIPYNEMFKIAILSGNIVEFISGNYNNSNKEDPNYLFIQAVKKACYMIIKKAEQRINQGKEIRQCGR